MIKKVLAGSVRNKIVMIGIIPIIIMFLLVFVYVIPTISDLTGDLVSQNLLSKLDGDINSAHLYMDRYLGTLTYSNGSLYSVDVPDYAIKLQDEFGDLARGLDTLCRNLRELIKTTVEMANGVNSGSEQVSSASEEMSSSLEEVSASTNEFASNATSLSENSQVMAETNAKILERAEESNQAIEDAVNQMQVINNRVSELQEVITEVDQRSSDIGKILSVITDIADQTNLLALNAAIEAARAGEQGRGFAVVAEEVRKLAEQSAGAAKEIGDLITATQEESSKALESMQEGVKDVENGTEVVSKTGITFGEILSDVKSISKQVEETVSAAEELRSASERLNQELQKFKYE